MLYCIAIPLGMQYNTTRNGLQRDGATRGLHWRGRPARGTMAGTDRRWSDVPYKEFPDTNAGHIARKEFWLSDEGLELIAGFRREGETIEEIFQGRVGITETTWRRWLAGSDGLRSAISQTDEYVNCLVEQSLLRRALGYEVVEVDEELVEGEMRVVRRRHRHVPPDTKAALSWLYSRRPDRWRAVQDPRDASTEQLRAVDTVLVSVVSASSEAAERASGGGGLPDPEEAPE